MIPFITGAYLFAAQLSSGSMAPNLPKLLSVEKTGETRTVSPSLIKGKVAIVDFWATWCTPCVATIPYLNGLAEQFKGKPVQFISISPEKPAVIAKFLGKTKMSGLVASDPTESTRNAWGVKLFPTAYLISADGQIVSTIEPNLLTAKMIQDALDGKFKAVGAAIGRGFDPSRGTSFIEQMTGEQRTFRGGFDPAYDYSEIKSDLNMAPYSTVVRPTLFKRSMGFHTGKNATTIGITVVNWPAIDFIQNLEDTLAAYIRIDMGDKFPESRWDAVITRPLAGASDTQSAYSAMGKDLLNALLAAWQATIETREETVDALSIRFTKPQNLMTRESTKDWPKEKQKFLFTAQDACDFISANRGTPIYLADPSQANLCWSNDFPRDGTPWMDNIFHRLGVKLEPMKRKEKILHLVPLK